MGVGVLPFGNSKRKVLVFVIHHFMSAEELNVAHHPRAFMVLLILLMSIGSTLSVCHTEGTVKKVLHKSKVQL